MFASQSMTVPQIVHAIETASAAYYGPDANSPLSDAEYDGLVETLKMIDPDHPVLMRVGAPVVAVSGGWQKVRHRAPMGSLNKVQSIAELETWLVKLDPSDRHLVVTNKFDGISCFDGDTLVHLANGETVPIREIVERGLTPRVLTWDKGRGLITENVLAVHDNGPRENWVRLTFEDGSDVVCTEDHLFYVESDGWIAAKDLLGKNVVDTDTKS